MPKLPACTAKEVIRVLGKAGFSFVRQKGSHRIFTKGTIGVTVPYHPGDLRKSTLHQIVQQAGLTPEEFQELL